MTLTDAINILKNERPHCGKKIRYTEGDICEAFDIAIEALKQEPCEDMGEVSDGYHTFNQLYHQRAILFATIVNQNKDRAWKSYKHEDGKYCFDKDGEWFIVGIDTPKGSYTYHYSKEYWDYFNCEELECGKPWDGHTEEDVIRLLSLPPITPQQSCEDIAKAFQLGLAFGFGEKHDEMDRVMEEVKKAVTPQPMGRWIEHFDESGKWYECDQCHTDWGGPVNYCPNCGAKMESEDK